MMEVHAHSRHDVGLVGTWRNFEGGLCVASGSMSALSALLVKGDVACIERIYFLGVQLNWNCWLGVLLFC